MCKIVHSHLNKQMYSTFYWSIFATSTLKGFIYGSYSFYAITFFFYQITKKEFTLPSLSRLKNEKILRMVDRVEKRIASFFSEIYRQGLKNFVVQRESQENNIPRYKNCADGPRLMRHPRISTYKVYHRIP